MCGSSGMKVGTIDAIQPEGTRAKIVLKVDHDVSIPADAKAVIVAQNLVAARYVQLTPAYRSSGPTMRDGAMIPVERTAVPVEWDQVKDPIDAAGNRIGPQQPGVDTVGLAVHRQRRRRAGQRQRREAPADAGSTVGGGADPRQRQRQHRRHHQEPADLRFGACATATPRSCSSTTGWPPSPACSTTTSRIWTRP